MTKKKTVIKTVKVDKQKEAIKKALKKAEEFLVQDGDSIDVEVFDTYVCLSVSSAQEALRYPFKDNPPIPKADTAVWVQDLGDDAWLPRVTTGKSINGQIETYGFESDDEPTSWECWQLKNPNKGNKNGN